MPTMLPNLQQRVAAVERRAARLAWLHGGAWFVLGALGVVVAAAGADYLLRFQDAGLRWLVSLAVWGALGWGAVRWLLPAWRQRQSAWAGTQRIEIARRIERRFPQFHERLTSAVAFLQQNEDDPLAGSPALRRAVVAEADSLAVDIDFQDALDSRLPRRAALAATLATAALVGLMALDPPGALLAVTRLLTPWSARPWPRLHLLQFRDPRTQLAVGEDFELEVVNARGRLPDEVFLEMRFATPGGDRLEVKEMKPLGDVALYRLDNVRVPFSYRARGGDDSTAWIDLELVVPPKVVEFNVHIQPPKYTGRPAETAGRVVRALVGSHLVVSGRFDERVTKAVLHSEHPQHQPLPIAVAQDGTFRFPAAGKAAAEPWVVEKSGIYWFELADASGIASGRETRIEIQAVADSPPTISLETPADQTFVTPRALVPIKCLVKDDLAIQSVELRYLRPDTSDQEEHVLPLYTGPEQVAAPAPGTVASAGAELTLEETWDLSRIAGLAPGHVLAMRIAASDYLPQSSTSQVRRLTVISEAELENRVVQRQAAILGQLSEVLRMQREARGQISALEIRLRETGRLNAQDSDQLQSAALSQRQVVRLLSDPQDGIAVQIQSLLQELADNRVEGEATARRMRDLAEQVENISQQQLPGISQQLTALLKEVRAPSGSASQSCDETDSLQVLSALGSQQDAVIGTLEGLLGELSQWDSFSRLAREVGQIRQEQAKLHEETDSLRLKLAVALPTELSPDERAAARQLGQRQVELARRFDKIQMRMEELLVRLRESDPVAAGTLADALEGGRRLAIGGRMREAARSLNEQQVGPAERTQQVALSALQELLDLLANRRDRELAQTVKGLRAAATDLKDLAARQAELQAQLAAAAAMPKETQRRRELARLEKAAEKLAAEADDLARKLQRLEARRAAEATAGAAAQQRGAGQAAAAGAAEGAQRQAQDASRLLDEAKQQLQAAIEQAEQDLLREQMARLEQLLAGVVARQQNLLAETLRLDQLRDKQGGELPREQQATLRGVAAEQRTLAAEVGQFTAKLSSSESFVFALEVAQRQMLRAAGLLQRGETGNEPQAAEQAALTSLEQLLAALEPEEPGTENNDQPPGEAPNPSPSPEGAGIRSLAELKLLKLMQEELNRRTEELRRIAGGEKLTPAQRQELAALAEEQGRLADMVLDLIAVQAEEPAAAVPQPGDEKTKPPAAKKGSLDEALLRDLM